MRFGSQRIFSRCLIWALVCIAIAAAAQSLPAGAPGAETLQLLKKIYDEVKDFGPRPGEDFIKQDFFIGNDDDDDTNKDIHVSILIHEAEGRVKLKILVTYMERSRENSRVKIAKESKNVTCIVEKAGIRVENADYLDKELGPLAAEILKAVQNKKRLIRG